MNLFTSFANRIVFGHIELRWHSSAQIKKIRWNLDSPHLFCSSHLKERL